MNASALLLTLSDIIMTTQKGRYSVLRSILRSIHRSILPVRMKSNSAIESPLDANGKLNSGEEGQEFH